MVDFPAENQDLVNFGVNNKMTTPIDVRACYDEMMEDRGHYVFLRRALVAQDCAGVDDNFKEAEMDSPKCTQSGYPYEDIKIKVTCRLASERGLQTDRELTEMGWVGAHTRAYFLRFDTKPRSIDSILEITLDDCGEVELPYNIESIWDIVGEPKEYRDQSGGSVQYYLCFVRKRQLGK